MRVPLPRFGRRCRRTCTCIFGSNRTASPRPCSGGYADRLQGVQRRLGLEPRVVGGHFEEDLERPDLPLPSPSHGAATGRVRGPARSGDGRRRDEEEGSSEVHRLATFAMSPPVPPGIANHSGLGEIARLTCGGVRKRELWGVAPEQYRLSRLRRKPAATAEVLAARPTELESSRWGENASI